MWYYRLHWCGKSNVNPGAVLTLIVLGGFFCIRKPLYSSWLWFVFLRRCGFRTVGPSGRSARRRRMCSALLARCCPHTVCRSFRRPLWATVCAHSTPTTGAGPRLEWQAFLSCSCRRRSAASRPWRSHCRSAAWEARRRPTPWAFPTVYRRTARVCSRTCTSPRSPVWYPPRFPVRPARAVRLSCAAPRTVTCGEAAASPPCAAKRSSTPSPWASPNHNVTCVLV